MAFNNAILHGSEINHIRFDCIDSRLTGYVNGKILTLTYDDALIRGESGIFTGSFQQGGVVIRYDIVLMKKP